MIGIGYIEKTAKNKLKWVSNKESVQLEKDIKELDEEYLNLDENEKELDEWVDRLGGMLAEVATEDKYSYVTFDDIRSVAGTPAQKEETPENPFFIVKAPKGTVLEVPDVDAEQSEVEYPYRMNLTSEMEEILFYLVTNERVGRETK